MSCPDPILLLGEDHAAYGEIELRTPRRDVACALSVGADRNSPSRIHKGRADVPNEDALLFTRREDRSLLAVADSHHGHEASHQLLRRLAVVSGHRLPETPSALLEQVRGCAGDPSNRAIYAAASSLLVATWDHGRRVGFGVSFGDSTLAVIDGTGGQGPWDESACNERNTQFVSPCYPESLDPARAREFKFGAGPGDVIVAFTDGLDGCHYGFPDTSVMPRHVHGLWARASGDVEKFVRSAVELSLSGVEGNPGGQDNIAMVAISVENGPGV